MTKAMYHSRYGSVRRAKWVREIPSVLEEGEPPMEAKRSWHTYPMVSVKTNLPLTLNVDILGVDNLIHCNQ